MHQCAEADEQKFSTLFKPWQARQEEVCCSVCRIIFCCSQHRETHEDAEHGRMHAETARQQRQMRKGKKPLVCLSCCQVFISGLFVNESCNVPRHSGMDKAAGASHVLIIIPEWAVAKYLFPNRKRSWDKANDEDLRKVGIKVNRSTTVDNFVEDGNTVQENSFNQKSSIQSILTKQRKTELSVKRDRRVTFSPITAVAITSKESIIKVGLGKTQGEPSADSETDTSNTHPLPSQSLASTQSTAPIKQNADLPTEFSPLVPKDETGCKASAFSPFVEHDKKEDCVFSPPLPNEGTNGSPLMAPQMSSTPVCEHSSSERRSATMTDNSSEYQTSPEAGDSNEGIFSSLANIICCAFQALPSVVSQFFATLNETDDSDQREKEASIGRERRQRRRSATFTPYLPVSIKKRRLNRRKVDG